MLADVFAEAADELIRPAQATTRDLAVGAVNGGELDVIWGAAGGSTTTVACPSESID